jgi:Tfp pilus assembly protein PilN
MRAVNLLTPDLRSAPKGKGSNVPGPSAMETPGGIGAFVLMGALALCVAAIAGYVLANNVVKERHAQLAQVTAQSDATVAKAAKLRPYADFETVAQQRAGTVKALAGARFDWEQALRDLSRATPSNVYLSELKGTVGSGGTGGAAAASGLRGSIPSPAIELKGCTRSQPAVARLMSRLRNVQGVTRVTLAKSDKEATAGGGAGIAGGGQVSPCGKGNPPSFEMIVFFEKSAVGAALAGATGGAATGGAAPAASASGKPAASSTPAPGATPAPASSPAASTQGATP